MANVVGQRIRRREDPRFLRGEGRYVDDLSLPGALHLTFVRSYMAHAKINGIDKSAAQDAGAQVFVAADTGPIVNPPPNPPIDPPTEPPTNPADPNWEWCWSPQYGWHPAFVAGDKPHPPSA